MDLVQYSVMNYHKKSQNRWEFLKFIKGMQKGKMAV